MTSRPPNGRPQAPARRPLGRAGLCAAPNGHFEEKADFLKQKACGREWYGEAVMSAISTSQPVGDVLAQTGDGRPFQPRLSPAMDEKDKHSNPSSLDAARLLSSQLGITLRQAEVLHWVAQGKTTAEISTILGCSFHTVKSHIKVVFQRLGVNNRAGAISAAYTIFLTLLRQQLASPERGIPKKSRTD